jgi:nitroreductase
MDVMQAIRERRAERSFTGQQVEIGTIETLLHAAIQAPSAMNQQPWAFVVIQDRHLLNDYSERAMRHWAATSPPDPDLERLRAQVEDPEFHLFYDAPTLIVICAKPGGLNPAEDCCLAAQNLMLAAFALGVGTCPIGLARPWLDLPDTKREVGIPESYSVVFPVILGYARTDTAAPKRGVPEIRRWK